MSIVKKNQPGHVCCCAEFFACFSGKCFQLVLNGVEGDDCCGDVNGTTWRIPIFTGTDTSAEDRECFAFTSGGFDQADIVEDVGCELSLCSTPNTIAGLMAGGGFLINGACGGRQLAGFFVDPLYSTQDQCQPSRYPPYLLPNALPVDPTDEQLAAWKQSVDDTIAALCGGGEVVLNAQDPYEFQYGVESYCDYSNSTLTISLVSEGEDCTPVPPPEVLGSCDSLSDCTTLGRATATATGLEDCTIPDDTGAGDLHPFLEERTYGNLNDVAVLLSNATAVDVSLLHCVSADKFNYFGVIPGADFTSADNATRYLRPGILINRLTTAGDYRDEYYAVAYGVETECDPDYEGTDNRRVNETHFHILFQTFRLGWDGTGYNTILLVELTCDSYTATEIIKGAFPFPCTTFGGAESKFSYDKCGTPIDFLVDLETFFIPI